MALSAEEAEPDLDDRFTIIEGRWNAALWSSQCAPPDPQFIERIRGIAIAASMRAEILAEYLDESDYSRKPVRSGKDLTLSHELSPAARRPGPPEACDVFDAAVLRLGLAMESESIAEVQAATQALSVTMSQLADVLDERIGPYPGTSCAAPSRPSALMSSLRTTRPVHRQVFRDLLYVANSQARLRPGTTGFGAPWCA